MRYSDQLRVPVSPNIAVAVSACSTFLWVSTVLNVRRILAGRDFDALAYPVHNRVLFAGEHTMRPFPSTAHGRFLSTRVLLGKSEECAPGSRGWALTSVVLTIACVFKNTLQ